MQLVPARPRAYFRLIPDKDFSRAQPAPTSGQGVLGGPQPCLKLCAALPSWYGCSRSIRKGASSAFKREEANVWLREAWKDCLGIYKKSFGESSLLINELARSGWPFSPSTSHSGTSDRCDTATRRPARRPPPPQSAAPTTATDLYCTARSYVAADFFLDGGLFLHDPIF